jgi:hypothetical protein
MKLEYLNRKCKLVRRYDICLLLEALIGIGWFRHHPRPPCALLDDRDWPLSCSAQCLPTLHIGINSALDKETPVNFPWNP